MKNRFVVRGDITIIFLDRQDGTVIETIIDTADLPKAAAFPNKWCARWTESTKSFRPCGQLRGRHYYLYRWILGLDDPNLDVDHLNHDTLDNRRANLRIVTRSENHQNRRGAPAYARTSQYRGVSLHKPTSKWKKTKWRAYITLNGKQYSLGYYDTEEEAAQVAQEARRRLMPFSRN